MAQEKRKEYLDSFIDNWYDYSMEHFNDFDSKWFWKSFTKLIVNIPLRNIDPSLTPNLMRAITLGNKLHKYLLYYMRADCPQCIEENEGGDFIDGLHRYIYRIKKSRL